MVSQGLMPTPGMLKEARRAPHENFLGYGPSNDRLKGPWPKINCPQGTPKALFLVTHFRQSGA